MLLLVSLLGTDLTLMINDLGIRLSFSDLITAALDPRVRENL